MMLINLREININTKSFDFKIQATEAVKPVSPNYALGNGVGTGGKRHKCLRQSTYPLRIKGFPVNTGHETKEDCLQW